MHDTGQELGIQYRMPERERHQPEPLHITTEEGHIERRLVSDENGSLGKSKKGGENVGNHRGIRHHGVGDPVNAGAGGRDRPLGADE